MRKTISPFLRLFFFWIFLFFLNRVIFLLFHREHLAGIGFMEILKSFFYGLSLDISVTGYLMVFPFLAYLISQGFRETAFLEKILFYYHALMLFLVALLNAIDLNIYREWGSKVNNRAIEFFFQSPGEALASSSSSPVLLSLLIIALVFFIGFVLLKKWVRFDLPKLDIRQPGQVTASLLIPFMLFAGIRGGFKLAPINQSNAYFSEVQFMNHAAVNTEWNLLHSSIENSFDNSNPYRFFETEDVCKAVKDLYPDSLHATDLFSVKNPNIIYIILESFTSDLLEAAGGEKGITPFLNSFAGEGLFFDQVIASGDRTDKGLIAILSSFPSQGIRTIIQQPDKFEKLPSITRILRENGYQTSFIYGGELEFSNFKSYLLSSGYETLIGKEAFPDEQVNSKWGAHDEFILRKQLEYLRNEKEPFFSTVLTLSSHEPFEVPIQTPFKGDDLPDKFRKAAYYTDYSLRKYFEEAKKQPWYSNTVFVLLADHGHRLPKEYAQGSDYRKFRIPLLICGEGLNPAWKRQRISAIGSQTDLNATLLAAFGMKNTQFPWSANLLDTNRYPFAFYSFDNGFGWITTEQVLTFDNVSKRVIYRKNKLNASAEKRSLDQAKAYMQCVYQTYLDY